MNSPATCWSTDVAPPGVAVGQGMALCEAVVAGERAGDTAGSHEQHVVAAWFANEMPIGVVDSAHGRAACHLQKEKKDITAATGATRIVRGISIRETTAANMTMRRRDFLRTSVVAAGGIAAGATGRTAFAKETAPSQHPATLSITADGELVVSSALGGTGAGRSADEVRRGIPGRRWVMVIDLAACDGCGKCTEACSKSHFVPSDREFIRIFKMRDSSTTAPYWFPRPCFHCDNPPCTRVCPVGATFKRQDGIVLIDAERCIGCRFCMAACPFSARVFNWSHPNNPPAAEARGYSPEWGYPRKVGTAEKCDFCADMARDGKLPHCVARCSMDAMWFGDENEDAVTNASGRTVRLSTLLRDRAGYRFMEDLGTKPRVYYLPPDNRTAPAPGESGASSHTTGVKT